MSVDAHINFYGLGWYTACAKLGAQLETPTDQTPQIHTDVKSPATNEPESIDTSDIWNESDRKADQNLLPEHTNLTEI